MLRNASSGPFGYRTAGFLRGIEIHWSLNGRLWAGQGYTVISSCDDGESWSRVATIPSQPINRLLIRIGIFRRLLRLGIRSYLQISEQQFIAFCDESIFFWRQGLSRPYSIGSIRRGKGPLLQGCCHDDRGNCYYGEYWGNPEREEVNVYSLKSGTQEWKVFYSFPRQTIRHVHAVQFDPFSKNIWIATGDHDSECRIGYFESTSSGPQLVTIASGKQMTRAVSLLFTPKYVYWGSDTGGRGDAPQSNYIYRWSRLTQKLEQLFEIGGPAYYSSVDAEGRLFVSTTVEGGSSEKDSFARVWSSFDGTQWQEIARWKKDKYPFVFGYGVLSFPRGHPSSSKLYVIANGLESRTGTWVLEPNPIGPSSINRSQSSHRV
jgi:hypothetical protein